MRNNNFLTILSLFLVIIFSCKTFDKDRSKETQKKNTQNLFDGLFDDNGEEHITIIDSLRIDKNKIAFCFINVGIIGGGDAHFMCITDNVCKVSRKISFAVAPTIYGFSHIEGKTIYIYGIERPTITDSLQNYYFNILDLGNQENFKKYKEKKIKDILLKDLCK